MNASIQHALQTKLAVEPHSGNTDIGVYDLIGLDKGVVSMKFTDTKWKAFIGSGVRQETNNQMSKKQTLFLLFQGRHRQRSGEWFVI